MIRRKPKLELEEPPPAKVRPKVPPPPPAPAPAAVMDSRAPSGPGYDNAFVALNPVRPNVDPSASAAAPVPCGAAPAAVTPSSSDPPQHITSVEQLNFRLARDPNDPFVLKTVEQLRLLMHERQFTKEQALAEFFRRNEALNQRLATKVVHQDPRRIEYQRTLQLLAVFCLAVLGGLALVYSPEERGTLLKLAMPLVSVLLASSTKYGYFMNRTLARHSVWAGLLWACFWYEVTFVCVAVFCWLRDPHSSFADNLRWLVLPAGVNLEFVTPELFLALGLLVLALLCQPLWLRVGLVAGFFGIVMLSTVRYVGNHPATATVAAHTAKTKAVAKKIRPRSPLPKTDKERRAFLYDNLRVWVRPGLIAEVLEPLSYEEMQRQTEGMDISARMDCEVDPESWTGRIVNPKSEERSPCRRNVVNTVLI